MTPQTRADIFILSLYGLALWLAAMAVLCWTLPPLG